jgi:hypothetical protein
MGGNGGAIVPMWFVVNDGDVKTEGKDLDCGDRKKKTSFVLNILEFIFSIMLIAAFGVYFDCAVVGNTNSTVCYSSSYYSSAPSHKCVCHVSSATGANNGFVRQYPMTEWEVAFAMLYFGFFIVNSIIFCTVLPPTSARWWIVPIVHLACDIRGKFECSTLCKNRECDCCCDIHKIQTCCDESGIAVMAPENHVCENKCCHPWRCFATHVQLFYIALFRVACFGISIYMFVELVRSNNACVSQCQVSSSSSTTTTTTRSP